MNCDDSLCFHEADWLVFIYHYHVWVCAFQGLMKGRRCDVIRDCSGAWDCAGSGCGWASCLHWTSSDEDSEIPPFGIEDSPRLTLLLIGLRWKRPLAILKNAFEVAVEFLKGQNLLTKQLFYVDNCSFDVSLFWSFSYLLMRTKYPNRD